MTPADEPTMPACAVMDLGSGVPLDQRFDVTSIYTVNPPHLASVDYPAGPKRELPNFEVHSRIHDEFQDLEHAVEADIANALRATTSIPDLKYIHDYLDTQVEGRPYYVSSLRNYAPRQNPG